MEKAKQYSSVGYYVPKSSAQVVGEYLDQLAGDRGLTGLTPAEVVADAKRPASPLHTLFQWDDSTAAAEYRLFQARNILRSIQVRFVNLDPKGKKGAPVHAFVSLSPVKDEGRRYLPMATVLSNEKLRQELLAQALKELQDWQQKYSRLKELSVVFVAIRKVVKKK